MARPEPNRERRQKAASRDAYRRDLEEARAKRMAGTITVQPFDPRRFADQMRLQSWATIHTVVFATAITAVLTVVAHGYGVAYIGAFAALLCMGALYPYLLRVWGLDLRELARGTMAVGIFLSYFVAWMATAFLVSNPPVFDDAPPELRCCAIQEVNASGGWEQFAGQLEWHAERSQWLVNATRNESVIIDAANGSARVYYGAYDSGGVAAVTFQVFGNDNTYWPPIVPDTVTNGTFSHDFTNLTAGSYHVDLSAEDRLGHHAQMIFQFQVRAPA